VSVEEGLEDKDSGYLVDYGAVFGAGSPCCMEMTMGLGGGEALVP